MELSKETGLLPCHGQPHVLTFARAEVGIANQFALPADCPASRQEHITRPRAPSIGASQVAGVAVPPQLLGNPLAVANSLPTGALEVTNDVLNPLPMRPPRVGIELAEATDRGSNIGPRADHEVHQGPYCTPVRNPLHLRGFCCRARRVLLAQFAARRQWRARGAGVGDKELQEHLREIFFLQQQNVAPR